MADSTLNATRTAADATGAAVIASTFGAVSHGFVAAIGSDSTLEAPFGRYVQDALVHLARRAGPAALGDVLDDLSRYAASLASAARMASGEWRTVKVPDGHLSARITLSPYDDEAPVTVRTGASGDGSAFELNLADDRHAASFAALAAHGIATSARVFFPRADRYGVPVEATDDGCSRAVRDHGFALSTAFQAFAEDSGDDTPMTIEIEVATPGDALAAVCDPAAKVDN